MDFAAFCNDYGISTAPHGHRHRRPGWINVACPFCTGHTGYHLGYNARQGSNHFVCYRCHGHKAVEVIAELAHVSRAEAKDIIEQYGGNKAYGPIYKKKKWVLGKNLNFPINTMEVDNRGLAYLTSRGYDAEKIVKQFGLMQTGPVGMYKHRLVIPIYFNDFAVSFTCRSIFPQVQTRYMTCPSSLELIPAKDILYNIDNARNRDTLVVVEGCTDVWRLGHGAVATFGTAVTQSQLAIMAKFKNIVLLQDSDMAGSTSWAQVARQLRSTCKVSRVKLTNAGDASELNDTDARYFMRSLGLSGI